MDAFSAARAKLLWSGAAQGGAAGEASCALSAGRVDPAARRPPGTRGARSPRFRAPWRPARAHGPARSARADEQERAGGRGSATPRTTWPEKACPCKAAAMVTWSASGSISGDGATRQRARIRERTLCCTGVVAQPRMHHEGSRVRDVCPDTPARRRWDHPRDCVCRAHERGLRAGGGQGDHRARRRHAAPRPGRYKGAEGGGPGGAGVPRRSRSRGGRRRGPPS